LTIAPDFAWTVLLGTASRILTAEIERPRVGPMRDIVATIQPEQDELVRADLDVSICVQGASGTGNPNPGNRHTPERQ
jgi:DNA helicase IV